MRKLLAYIVCFVCVFTTLLGAAEGAQEFADFSETFPDRFLAQGEDIVKTDTLYQSQNIFIEISSERIGRSDVFVADIYVRTPEVFGRAFGGGKWRSKMQSVKTIATDNDALLALTGDNAHNFDVGFVVANGELKRKSANKKRDLCILYLSGEMVTLSAAEVDVKALTENAAQIWQTFLFGPVLLKEGEAIEKFSSNVAPANPRAAIGYFEPGHYCFVQVDGRGTKSAVESGKTNVGMMLKELSQFFKDIGCTAAYNLDGGQSALMWFGGKVISTPYKGGRSIGDILMIKELEEN